MNGEVASCRVSVDVGEVHTVGSAGGRGLPDIGAGEIGAAVPVGPIHIGSGSQQLGRGTNSETGQDDNEQNYLANI